MPTRKRKQTAPVTLRAVIQRINRTLKKDGGQIKAARSERARQSLGDFYVVDTQLNAITAHDVDPEELARELGLLMEYEELVDE